MEKLATKGESHDERIVRLARTARERGIRVYSDDAGKQWFATSATQNGVLHYITAVSCTCRGFVFSGACTHHSALLDRLGWLPRVADESPASMPCLACRGAGEIWSEGQWSADRCFICDGRGHVDVAIDYIAPSNIIPFPSIERPRPAA